VLPSPSEQPHEPVETVNTHPLAHGVADAYLALVDAVVPEFVEALYLVGSAAMGDFRPPLSDVNFVAVSQARPGRGAMAALAEAHAGLARGWPAPALDGVYLTWDGKRAGPLAVPNGPLRPARAILRVRMPRPESAHLERPEGQRGHHPRSALRGHRALAWNDPPGTVGPGQRR
jgi:hypothetical protein